LEKIWLGFSGEMKASIKRRSETMLEGPKCLGGAAYRWGHATWRLLVLVAPLRDFKVECPSPPKNTYVGFFELIDIRKVPKTSKYEKEVFCLPEIKYQ
jgi:hypothetical protein